MQPPNSRNSLLIQTLFLLYITSFSICRSFKDLLFRGLGEDIFFSAIMSEESYCVNCMFLSKITNVGFHGKPLIFFLGPGIHGLLFEFWVVFTKMLAEKFDTLVVFMKCKKKIETTWCPGWAFRPPLRPPLRSSGPA